MILSRLSLHNFRSYTDFTCDFDPQLTLIIAPNASGKTNLLEAIHFVSTGQGINEEKKEELVHFGEQEMDVRAVCDHSNHSVEFKASIQLSENTSGTKSFFIDRTRKTLYYYIKESFPVVLFSPSFMNIIEGSPSKRRMFVDIILSKIDITYRKSLRNYENGIRKRNKILETERNEGKLKEALHFWDGYVIEQGTYVTQKREWFAEFANKHPNMVDHAFQLDYQPNRITQETLDASFEKQYYQRRTLVGPQRDDFRILKAQSASAPLDVHRYCSRGEQRLALLWLILHQLNVYVEYVEYPPLLLLDDILSELDESNKGIIQKLVGTFQTVITSAEEISDQIIQPGQTIRL